MPRSRISGRHLSGSPFETRAGAVGVASRPRPRPAPVAPSLGRKLGGRLASALQPRNCPGRHLSALPAGGVGKCKAEPGALSRESQPERDSEKRRLPLPSAPGISIGAGMRERRTSCAQSSERRMIPQPCCEHLKLRAHTSPAPTAPGFSFQGRQSQGSAPARVPALPDESVPGEPRASRDSLSRSANTEYTHLK